MLIVKAVNIVCSSLKIWLRKLLKDGAIIAKPRNSAGKPRFSLKSLLLTQVTGKRTIRKVCKCQMQKKKDKKAILRHDSNIKATVGLSITYETNNPFDHSNVKEIVHTEENERKDIFIKTTCFSGTGIHRLEHSVMATRRSFERRLNIAKRPIAKTISRNFIKLERSDSVAHDLIGHFGSRLAFVTPKM